MDHFIGALNAQSAKCQSGFTPISDGTGNAFCVDPEILDTLRAAALPQRRAMQGLGKDDDAIKTTVQLIGIGVMGYIAYKMLKGTRRK